MFVDSETFHTWADGQPSPQLPRDPWSVGQDGDAAPLRPDPAHQVRPACRAREGHPVGAGAAGEAFAVAPPVVRGRGVGHGDQVAVTVTDQRLGHNTPPTEHDRATSNPNTPVSTAGSANPRRYYDPRWSKQRRLELRRETPYLPAVHVAEHVAKLMATGVVQHTWIADAAHVSRPTVRRLTGPHVTGRVRAPVARAILAVTIGSALAAAPAGSLIPAVGAVRRLQALQWAGWRHSDFAARGIPGSSFVLTSGRTHISVGTHRTVCAAYDALWDQEGPSEHTRRRARARGWVPALAWDDDTIDDPTATPDTGANESGVVSLDLVIELLGDGDTLETVARRLGVTEEALVTAARRKGTPDQKARIAQASEAMRDIRVALAS